MAKAKDKAEEKGGGDAPQDKAKPAGSGPDLSKEKNVWVRQLKELMAPIGRRVKDAQETGDVTTPEDAMALAFLSLAVAQHRSASYQRDLVMIGRVIEQRATDIAASLESIKLSLKDTDRRKASGAARRAEAETGDAGIGG